MSEPMLTIDAIRAGYPAARGFLTVVDGLSLTLDAGEIGCLLGSSGCGKTTVLRVVAGFEPLQAGRIDLHGRCIAGTGVSMPAEQRGIGMMFQDYALFPHLRVDANVGFGLAGLDAGARRERVTAMLALVGLTPQARAYPHELSGGQQQRVALARALAPAPTLLLLDEPFSNLDGDTRERLAGELRAILKATGITALMVTHDQAEAFAMADRIGVIDRGRILQWGTPRELYCHPADRDVATFVGRGSLLQAAALGLPGDGDVLLRPGQLVVDAQGTIRAVVLATTFRGPGQTLRLRLGSGDLVDVDVAIDRVAAEGSALTLRLVDDRLPAFPSSRNVT